MLILRQKLRIKQDCDDLCQVGRLELDKSKVQPPGGTIDVFPEQENGEQQYDIRRVHEPVEIIEHPLIINQ